MKKNHLAIIANDEPYPVLSYNSFLYLLDHGVNNWTAPRSPTFLQRLRELLQQFETL